MKLLVMILCLLSERYLIQKLSNQRFDWYVKFRQSVNVKISAFTALQAPWGIFIATVILPSIIFYLIYLTLGGLFFGFAGFVMSLLAFFYCLGPQNPFYPVREEHSVNETSLIEAYFSQMNEALFAPIIWFIVAGPVGVVFYRLAWLNQRHSENDVYAQLVLNILNWFPIRICALLYLLVGNFQKGFSEYLKLFFTAPEHNLEFLRQTGLAALKDNEQPIDFVEAEHLVEHALIFLLVFIAFSTLVSWL